MNPRTSFIVAVAVGIVAVAAASLMHRPSPATFHPGAPGLPPPEPIVLGERPRRPQPATPRSVVEGQKRASADSSQSLPTRGTALPGATDLFPRTLHVGDSLSLLPLMADGNGKPAAALRLQWTAQPRGVVAVDPFGSVTGLTVGVAEVTVIDRATLAGHRYVIRVVPTGRQLHHTLRLPAALKATADHL